MAKQIRISDIASKAGVSAGTVDRIIHNRGNVSKAKREAVEKVLKDIGYETNTHLTSMFTGKQYNIAITVPEHTKGGYWSDIHRGCLKAIQELSNIKINYTLYHYNQYDVYSCSKAHKEVIEAAPDAVIIGPTFNVEALLFTKELDKRGCPYIFVDSYVEGANPVSYYVVHQRSVGALAGKLISQVTPDDSELVHLQAERIGDQSANNIVLRKIGLMHYLESIGKADSIHTASFSIDSYDKDDNIKTFFKEHPKVKGAVVLSSKASDVVRLFKRCNITDVHIVGVDLTETNLRAIRANEIDYVVCQYPQQQGYLALKNIIHYLLFGACEATSNFVPITIVTKENIEFHRDM